jgi:hypothetical protein
VNRLFAPPPGFDPATLFAAYLTEHWNTRWADRFLFDQRPPDPPHPLPRTP